ncbi:GH92 family glycosyl hydrolase [Mucilaginibacter psychrotolerans]|uniref:Glycoside hydrolase family 92 protein n=1 Tax=Mucilaginibacter psychrotolerans TaxID=1524096 RepID=A0A4Y8SK56_9SPHI|nr:GH92 family glycosyl hydrolase [Mucilaginibacter psychrotolerans]TFF38897.1 glycoside hydrolase family 92 protein [Mucilaginibacter psychrotolerans]
MKKYSIYFLVSIAVCSLSLSISAQTKKKAVKTTGYTSFVDPFIGSALHGHVFVGANVPFGAVQLGPVNIKAVDWDWCSGYNYSDSTIAGFAHTHLSGTGIGDLGDIQFMPTTGDVKVLSGDLSGYNSGYYSLFSHKEEMARPGFYSVKLKRYNIGVRLTTTTRVGFHEYTFPKSDNAHIVIDLQKGIGWDHPVETYIKQVNDTTVIGYRHSSGWSVDDRIYFAAIFSKRISNFAVYDSLAKAGGTELKGRNVKGVLNFATAAGEKVKIKVGISPVSMENALANINAEACNWDFDKVKNDANTLWNNELSKIAIKATPARMRTFYTAFYHTMIAPSVYNDYNGDYLGTDKKVYHKPGFTNVTTMSLWDTYRAENPLMTITQPQRVNDQISSMLAIYQQQGRLPVWPLMGSETDCMVGNSAIPVIADAFLKGYTGFDRDLAYEAVKTTAMGDRRGLKFVKELGYIPADTQTESVATGMEYAIDDWCIAQMAKKLGKMDDYEYFSKRGRNYANYYNSETHFMRGRLGANEWRSPFSPFVSRHMKDDFTEGNAWQYTWLVPQDVEGLMQLLGGRDAFIKKLDSLFIAKGDMGNEASNDITGLIGQYAHGNEPSHHITYMYAYAGQQYKTAEKVRFILDSFYTNKKDGIIGNEDVGQMSAWYVLSAMGFYPLNPANGAYVFGSPVINDAVLKLAGGKSFHISIKNNTGANKYIQSVTLNGKRYPKAYLLHSEIAKGGNLTVTMGSKPSAVFGVAPSARPKSVY